jgi:hypothetical protein
VQAVQARLPARPARIFPLHINTWGRLTPVVAGLLVLLYIVDLPQFDGPGYTSPDTVVTEQGVQLREYGRRMEVRAQREELPRSSEIAQSMQRLGSRMESAGLSREQALNRLRQLATDLDAQRQAALNFSAGAGSEIQLDPQRLQTMTLRPTAGSGSGSLRQLLEDLASGRLQAGDARFSSADEAALSRNGITPQELEQALKDLEAGDEQRMRRILETLARSDQALRDAEELDKARQKLNRVRENLGDNVTADTPTSSSAARTAAGSGADDDDNSGSRSDYPAEFSSQDGATDGGGGAGYSPQGNGDQPAPFAPQQPQQPAGVVLKPESRLTEQGDIFTSEVRALPRTGQPTVETAAIASEYKTQVEEALSKEEYPLHQKELIRRYFLTLSEGAAVPAKEQQP